ncbi:protein FAM131C [Syngnathoides biaculeatus]|uniref:protein FAM131C n=1 Tax=Syngnathoides biaculeatus TaxID=300417 RepID=UPI002ADD9610|nr:protein FAM131C [Syngnathoides biaculeatus]XP_061669058.1 protein FAM131C [Syngnathoides biaculeatus]
MGCCLCKSHKDVHYPVTALHEGHPAPSGKDEQAPSNDRGADKSNHYSIGELATSSLLGLVATIKEHITKPTAMAQGRVAHLIEWKGWGGGGEAGPGGGGGGWSGGWSRGRGSWGPQEDEQFYSQMTDEIKEARFAAGVAEQFALAEAAMSVWPVNDCFEQLSSSLQGAQRSHLLSCFLLDDGGVSVPQYLHNLCAQAQADCQLSDLVAPQPPPVASIRQQERNSPSEDKHSAVSAEAAVRHIDSSSLSEDDVFYN